MDTLSGSLQDSEPTSPTSPASTEPRVLPTSPIAISQALSSLSQSSVHLRGNMQIFNKIVELILQIFIF